MKEISINKIFNIGISGAKTDAEANRIKLINMIAIMPFFIFLPIIIYCIYADYPRIVYLNTAAITFSLIALLLNYKHSFTIAKSILICTHSATILCYYKLMMDEPSVFFFYFPLIVTIIIFYNPKEEKKFLVGTILFMLSCVLLTLFLPNKYFKPSPLPDVLHKAVYIINAFTCIALFAFYVFKMFKVNIRNENILTKANIAAEQAVTAKAVFLSNMSHELRTPLNGIIGTTHILKSEKYLPEQEYHLTVMSSLSQHMLGLVNNVLDFSKIDANKLELDAYQFTIKDLVNKTEMTFKNLFDDKGVEFLLDLDKSILTIELFADELRLQQVINNLISNALKFTDKDGSVTFSISKIKKDAATIILLFSVSDTGIGIASHHQAKIFESFSQGDSATTRKYGGTGLGLSISNMLVKKFDGLLNLTSEKGKGSRFSFNATLPLYLESKKNAKIEKAPTDNGLNNFKVLIAEDNKVNMMVAKKIMQKWGIIVTEAENGLIACDKYEVEHFDLVLLDLEMPVMDGRTALKKIKASNKSTPIIAFTAGMYDNMKSDLLNEGFTDYILKPFIPEDLYRKIITARNNNFVATSIY